MIIQLKIQTLPIADGDLRNIIAKRLIDKAKIERQKLQSVPAKPPDQLLPVKGEPPPKSFKNLSSPVAVRIEKNLASLGFFTPSSKRLKNLKSKVVKFTQKIDGTRVDLSATIVPSALLGLPITADQDKYIALQKIILDRKRDNGGVLENPISFTSAELLRVLNKYLDSGKNYKEVGEWLDVMNQPPFSRRVRFTLRRRNAEE